MTPIHTQNQKIGKSKGARRVCLWNRIMIDCGFPIGQPIELFFEHDPATGGEFLCITPNDAARKKVSRVVNHGNVLPVIDIKENKSLDLDSLGNIGDSVRVDFYAEGEIRISSI